MHFLQTIADVIAANAVIVGLLIGAVTPLVTSVVQQPKWSSRTRTIVAAVVALVVGIITVAATGDLSHPVDLIATLTAVYAASEAFYQKLWSKTGVTQSLEFATSPASSQPLTLEDDEYDDSWVSEQAPARAPAHK